MIAATNRRTQNTNTREPATKIKIISQYSLLAVAPVLLLRLVLVVELLVLRFLVIVAPIVSEVIVSVVVVHVRKGWIQIFRKPLVSVHQMQICLKILQATGKGTWTVLLYRTCITLKFRVR